MNEIAQYKGTFAAFDNYEYSTEEIREILRRGIPLWTLKGLVNAQVKKNVLMASQKLAMATAVYSTIDRLVITNQTSIPSDAETSYTGAIYTSLPGDETSRSEANNPYTVSWNIVSDTANGSWGSFVLINSTGAMINRALAGITKISGTAKLIMFTGSVN